MLAMGKAETKVHWMCLISTTDCIHANAVGRSFPCFSRVRERCSSDIVGNAVIIFLRFCEKGRSSYVSEVEHVSYWGSWVGGGSVHWRQEEGVGSSKSYFSLFLSFSAAARWPDHPS